MQEKDRAPAIRFVEFTDDWKQRKLGEITKIQSASRVHKEEWRTEGIPFFRSSDVMAAFNGTENERAFISEELFEKLSAVSGKPQEGDIFVTGGGSVGTPYYVPNNAPLYSKDADLIWIRRNSLLDPHYTYFYFVSPVFKEYLSSISHVGTIAHYTIEQVKETPISVPPVSEQKRIGTFFRRLDRLITLHQRKYSQLCNIKKSMLERMFPKEGTTVPEIRFAGFTGDWERRKLGEIMDVTSVKRIHQSDWTTEGVRFLRARDIVSDFKKEEPDDYLYISKEKYDEYSAISGKVDVDDLLVTGVGTIGIPYLVRNLEPLYFKDGNIIWFKNGGKIDGNFLYYSFISSTVQGFIEESAGIGTVGTYTIESGKKTPVYLPSCDEQQAIGTFFRRLDRLITLHQRELERLQNIKKACLEKMFV